MAERCVCCDLPVESCGKRLEDQEVALEREVRAAMLATPRWIAAKWGGTCQRCNSYDYSRGEPITFDGDGWAAGCCFDEIQKGRASGA
jgi:hypothetical protein